MEVVCFKYHELGKSAPIMFTKLSEPRFRPVIVKRAIAARQDAGNIGTIPMSVERLVCDCIRRSTPSDGQISPFPPVEIEIAYSFENLQYDYGKR